MATQTNSQIHSKTKLKSALPAFAPGADPNAAQSLPGEIPATARLDTAALSAGVKAVMGKDVAADAPKGAAVAEAKEQEEIGNALIATTVAMEEAEASGFLERQGVRTRLPVQLVVGIPIRDFRVKNLLVLEPGSLIESSWVPGEDVPVASGEVQLAWSEFEVVDSQLAVRLTRLT